MSGTNRLIIAGSLALFLGLAASEVNGQNNPTSGGQRGPNPTGGGRRQRGGNFDPAQFQQRAAERYRERLEITDDSEWKAIQPRIQKVLDGRMALESGRRAMFERDRNSRSGRDRNTSDQPDRRTSTPTATTNPAAEALQKAIADKAPASDLKAAAARYLEDRKSKQANLEKAQEELRMVLTQRQESIAILAGLL